MNENSPEAAPPTALVVVDMQRALLHGPDAIPHAERVLACVRELVRRARAAGALVLHLQNDGPPGSVDETGSPGWALVVEPLPGERVLRKREDDGFVGTDLGVLLDRHGVSTLVVAGVQSEMCVAATARTAMSRGRGVVLPRAGHGTHDIPADAQGGVAVSASQVARVVEWSLGDEVVVVDDADDVAFLACPTIQIDDEGA